MKKIIILGGSGFIGKSLKNYLNNNKNNKYKLISYSRTENKNILKIKKLPKSELIFYCIKSNKISESLKYFNHFKKLLTDNLTNTKIIFVSSGAVYGSRNKLKKFNEYDKININKLKNFKNKKYAEEKIFLEKKFKILAKNNYKISIVRGFSFIGKNILLDKYFISQLINCIKLKKRILIQNPYTFRSYMHETDMCKWLIKIGEHSSTDCPIYNVGSNKTINIAKLAQDLSIIYKFDLVIKKPKKIKYDFYVPSTNLANRKLKLKNTINIKHAIKQLLNK